MLKKLINSDTIRPHSQEEWLDLEEIFGWMKTIGGLRKTRYRGVDRTQLHAYLVAAAYNLVRMRNLLPVAT